MTWIKESEEWSFNLGFGVEVVLRQYGPDQYSWSLRVAASKDHLNPIYMIYRVVDGTSLEEAKQLAAKDVLRHCEAWSRELQKVIK